jgi:hypothetical protein
MQATVSDQQIRDAIDFGRFDNMRALETKGIFESENSSVLKAIDKSDETTFKTRKGRIGGYGEHLSQADIEYVNEVMREMGCPWYQPE